MVNKIDSNETGLAIAEEASIGVLPGTPNWYYKEVNSFPEYGGNPSLVTRKVLGTRKPQKGSVTGIDVKGGFNSDFTKSNLFRELQGFFFNDASENGSAPPMNGVAISATTVASADSSYAITGANTIFLANALVLASGFNVPANNGLKNVSSVTGLKAIVTQVLVNETPPATAKLQTVGYAGGSADLSVTYTAPATFTMASTALDFTTLGLLIGEWIYIGGDAAINHFATCPSGYARVSAVAAHLITFDKLSFTPVTDAGTGKNIHLYFGTVYQDGVTIKRRTYSQIRLLGNDGSGVGYQLLSGTVPNEFTLNIPKKDKLNADLSYVGINDQAFNGTTALPTGNYFNGPGEDAYNTSSDLVRFRLSVFDGSTILPIGFGYCNSGSIKIANNATVDEAVGQIAGFDVSVGDFEASGDVELFFTGVTAIQAVRTKKVCSLDLIVASLNSGWIYDLPFVELSGGLPKIEKGKAIMVSLSASAVQSPAGYCALFMYFPYLPTIAMPLNAAGYPIGAQT